MVETKTASVRPLSLIASAAVKGILDVPLNASGDEVLAAAKRAVETAPRGGYMRGGEESVRFKEGEADPTEARLKAAATAAEKAFQEAAEAWAAQYGSPQAERLANAHPTEIRAAFSVAREGETLFANWRRAANELVRYEAELKAEDLRTFGRECRSCGGSGRIRTSLNI